MVNRKRSTTKSVTFNQQDNDQELLIEIEKILATQRFKSFGELCKAALQYYLSSPTTNKFNKDVSKPELINQKLSQIQRQIDGFEGTVLLEYLEPLKQQVTVLSQQMQSLERKVDQPAQPISPLESRELEINSSPPPTVENDPVLCHLTPLLEDF